MWRGGGGGSILTYKVHERHGDMRVQGSGGAQSSILMINRVRVRVRVRVR